MPQLKNDFHYCAYFLAVLLRFAKYIISPSLSFCLLPLSSPLLLLTTVLLYFTFPIYTIAGQLFTSRRFKPSPLQSRCRRFDYYVRILFHYLHALILYI